MTFKYEIQIKEHHVDSIGHVNNATYLALYEEARWEAITDKGFGFKDIQRLQQGPVILEINLKFMKELLLREKIIITLEVLGFKGKIGQMKQQMIKPDGIIASEAVFTFGLFDLKTRKLIEPTAEFRNAVGLD